MKVSCEKSATLAFSRISDFEFKLYNIRYVYIPVGI